MTMNEAKEGGYYYVGAFNVGNCRHWMVCVVLAAGGFTRLIMYLHCM